jgi:hypothetical protein
MMIGHDIYDRFTMEHFPLRQSMISTTSFFLLATVPKFEINKYLQPTIKHKYKWHKQLPELYTCL